MLEPFRNVVKILIIPSVVDPHHFDVDPDLNYHPDADPDADPDSTL